MKDVMFVIPAFPLFGALVLVLSGRRLKEPHGGLLATGLMGLSFLASAVSFAALFRRPAEFRESISTLFSWIAVGSFRADVTFNFDTLSAVMCLVVTGVGTLIHFYSLGYMHGDENFTRFF